MVRSHRNSICDTCVKVSWSFDFFDIFAYLVVISRKTEKSAKNTIFDICVQKSKKNEFCDIFANTVVKSCKRSNHLRRPFVTLVHKSRGVLCFVTFSLIQL